ncbi:hemicentin-1 isoform X2 [Chrysoperla carnea]|uniref:hemicentin-1 isoform X2 n=1 Tax=Chrysoperla carnea TaxID=189513 RepID=UPI001D08C9C5|nr:hemicentin-1 isoform X2 [Chrysoperla carnea]
MIGIRFYSSKGLLLQLSSILLVAISVTYAGDEVKDTREGENVTLECRFSPIEVSTDEELTYYWVRNNKQTHDNVAIGKVPLDNNYRLDNRPEIGRYDLHITNASYERDNGRFECRIKEGGTGHDRHSQSYMLTVLTLPQPPRLAPGAYVTATEGKRQDLTCSSTGGSPDPSITWHREGTSYPLDAIVKNGGSRDQPTTSTLTLSPTREDDGAIFRCVVWNRAMPDGKKLEATVTLSVNYIPRVEVGPENPLRVEKDSPANLQCTVDAKPKVSNVRWSRNGRFISTSMSHTLHRVSLQDAGKYTCSAENGLGKAGEKEIILDVLYGPIVTLEDKTREAEEGETIEIKCNVTSNPSPNLVEWVKEGKPDFRQKGHILRLSRVTAENSGTYVCRATNLITPSALPIKTIEKIGNSSIAVLIRHKPGKAQISPDRPVANEGAGVTLTCNANPPGWPAPQYRWYREEGSKGQNVLATGTKYTIPRVLLSSEGVYHCQATNELGVGERASITLEVRQPPKFLAKLPPHTTRPVGDSEFGVSCSAVGKPKPTIRWLKDRSEITPDLNMYEVRTEPAEGRNGVFTVQSKLYFKGKARPDGNQLLPGDRGIYSCVFENEVKRAESTMQLKIEHEPIVLHQYNKVAYDINESAEVLCKVQAYPRPEFKWFFSPGLAPLQMSSDGHYEINTTTDNNDVYTSVLKVSNIKQHDYGEYVCTVVNNLGTIETKIRLQPKGPPEKPISLSAINAGHDFVTLFWEPGFNGGVLTTKYFVTYRKVPSNDEFAVEGCGIVLRSVEWQEVDCHQNIPCNVTNLDQHQTYVFKVKAVNTKGTSDMSDETTVTTNVDKIPIPQHVTFDPNTNGLTINVEPTCLPLVAIVECMANDNLPIPAWQVIDTLPMDVSGVDPTYKETILDHMDASRLYKSNSGRSLVDEEPISVADEYNTRVRVKFCLRESQDLCSEYTEADFGQSYIKEASALATPTLIVIIVCCVICILFIGLVLMFCRCKRNQTKKSKQAKDYEMDSVRPTIITSQQSQAPPPYYPTSGMENKALEHSMDLALAMEDPKNPVYATQNGYGYHVANTQIPNHPSHQNINGEWVNMGYMENSYSNSNNGGSVNSQDSLWQMKMAAAANNSVNQQHINVDRQNSYGYDPITHGGYGAVDDYAPYPHLTTQSNHGDDYMRNSNNPSRQEYCNDPYAAVHKPKKRVDQHIGRAIL